MRRQVSAGERRRARLQPQRGRERGSDGVSIRRIGWITGNTVPRDFQERYRTADR